MIDNELHEFNGIRAARIFHTESFLLTSGSIAKANTPEGKLNVYGSGKELRVDIEGIDGYVRINLQDIVDRAYELLTRDHG